MKRRDNEKLFSAGPDKALFLKTTTSLGFGSFKEYPLTGIAMEDNIFFVEFTILVLIQSGEEEEETRCECWFIIGYV